MSVEQQYIDLFSQTEAMICRHSAEVLNAPRAAAFADFERLGFPTRKQEKYLSLIHIWVAVFMVLSASFATRISTLSTIRPISSCLYSVP